METRDLIDEKRGWKVKLSRFDNMMDLARFTELEAPGIDDRPSRMRTFDVTDRSFNQTRDFDEAMKLVNSGWEKGLEMIGEMDARISLGDRTGKMTIQYDYCGDMIDMGRHLSGQPDCFIEPDIEEFGMGGPIKRIYIDGAFLASTRKKNLIRYAQALIPIIDAVERTGYRAEIWYIACSRNRKDSRLHYTIVKIKGADEQLNREKLMFVTGHVDMFRRMVFAVREQEGSRDPAFNEAFQLETSMGVSFNVEKGAHKILEELTSEKFDIIFNLGDASKIEEVEDVINRNRNMLQEQGVQI